MLIPARDYTYNVERHTCDYHRKHPGEPWAGCTCHSSISQEVHDKFLKESIERWHDAWEELARR